MIEIEKLSGSYAVRKLGDEDAEAILALCRENTQFYLYCAAEPTKEQVLRDLHLTPPDTDLSNKYYVGFYEEKTLIAVLDLVDSYPEPEYAFIGFFMMKRSLQGNGRGSAIIGEVAAYLKKSGKTTIRLAIDKDNPQSNHFWKKNGFCVVKEVDRDGWTLLVAEKQL